jgi:hypothetical protein
MLLGASDDDNTRPPGSFSSRVAWRSSQALRFHLALRM